MKNNWFGPVVVTTLVLGGLGLFALVGMVNNGYLLPGYTVNVQKVGAAEAQPSNEVVTDTSGKLSGNGWCPTRREVNDMLFGEGKDVLVEVSAEKSAWQVNTGNPKWTYEVTLPESTKFVSSMHLKGEDKAKVFYGDGETYEIWRGTFRFSGCYGPDDDMNKEKPWERILVKENFDGSVQEWETGTRTEDWTYGLLPGNFACTLFECPTTNVEGNLSANLPDSAPNDCPVFDGVQSVAKSDDGPYCKVVSSTKLTDEVPAGWKVDYWTGSETRHATAGDSISLYEATFRAIAE